MANIVVNTKTYSGLGVVNGTAQYVERSAGTASGFSGMSAIVQLAGSSKGSKTRIRWKFDVPVITAEATPCACPDDVIRAADVDVIVRFAKGATVAERTDITDRLKDLIASAQFRASLISLEQPAG